MTDHSWRWAVEIETLGRAIFVRTIEDGNVRIREFKRMRDAEEFAQGEQVRLNLRSFRRIQR